MLYQAGIPLPYLGKTAFAVWWITPLPWQDSQVAGLGLTGEPSLAWAGPTPKKIICRNGCGRHYWGRTPGCRAGQGRWTFIFPGQDSRLQGWTCQVNLSLTWTGFQVAGLDLPGEPLPYLDRTPGCRAGPVRWTTPLPGQDSRLQGWTWQVNHSLTWTGLQVARLDPAGEPLPYLVRTPGCRAGQGRWTFIFPRARLQVAGLDLAGKLLPYLGRTPDCRAGPARWTSPWPGQDSRLQGWTWQVQLSLT